MEYGVIEYLKGLYSVYDRMYSLCAVCKPQRFYSVYRRVCFLMHNFVITNGFRLLLHMYSLWLSLFASPNGLSRFIVSLFF